MERNMRTNDRIEKQATLHRPRKTSAFGKLAKMKKQKLALLFFVALLSSHCTLSDGNKTENNVYYAQGFHILEETEHVTVITDCLGVQITIVHDEKGSHDAASSDYTIGAPVAKVISTSAPAVSLIKSIEKTDSLAGVKLPAKSWHIEEVRERMKTGDISLIGNGSHDYVDYEQVLKIKPDIVFNNIEYPAKWAEILRTSGIKTASVCTHKENTLLGQFEWVKMVGAFYSEGIKAECVFNRRADRYNGIKTSIDPDQDAPKVLWGTVYSHRASVPGGASFIANAIEDGGGEYVLRKELENARGGYLACDLEMFYQKGVDADVFFLSNTKAGGIKTIEDLVTVNDILKNFKSVQTGNVWCYKPWFWQSVDKPDEIFRDIVAILHPGMFASPEIKNFERLGTKTE